MNPIWQTVIACLLTALVTGAGAYLGFARGALNRDDARVLITDIAVPREEADEVCATHCPYLKDESAIAVRLDAIERKTDLILALLEKWRPAA